MSSIVLLPPHANSFVIGTAVINTHNKHTPPWVGSRAPDVWDQIPRWTGGWACTRHPGVLGSIPKREEPGKTGRQSQVVHHALVNAGEREMCERRRGRRREVREGACIGAATMLQPWTIEVDPQFVCVCVCLLLQVPVPITKLFAGFRHAKKKSTLFFSFSSPMG